MYCIECGKEKKLYRNLCEDCFKEKYRFCKIPRVLKVTVCPSCNSRLRSKHWISYDDAESAIIDGMKEQVEIDPDIFIPNIDIDVKLEKDKRKKVEITCKFQFEDLPITEIAEGELRIKYDQCTNCSRMAASYFNAIIQLRANNRDLTELEADNIFSFIQAEIERVQKVDKSVFISKFEQIHGGYDLYLSSQNFARQIVRSLNQNFGGDVNSSSTLTGQKDGKNVYRMTYLFRLPEYQLGDIVDIEKKIAVIRNISNKRIEFKELKNWNKFHIEKKRLKNMRILGGINDYKNGQVVSRTASELEVLDLSSYKTLTVVLPGNHPGFEDNKSREDNVEKVYFYILNDLAYLIPEPK